MNQSPEYDPEGQEYGECPEQPSDPFEPQEEEEEQSYQEEAPPTETIKTILATMQDFMLESQAEEKALASVKVLQKDDSEEFPPIACRSGVLLDGGASHNVYYSAEIPEGSIKKQVELAHGSKIGYVRGEDIIFWTRREIRKNQNGRRLSVLVD